jgi:drug/metabolite transporter (DMT)-like permease
LPLAFHPEKARPHFAVLSGALLLVERITWGQGVGGPLIVAGVVAVNRRPARPKV